VRPVRLSRLVAAGLVDSFGLALGWTVFNLHAVATSGLGAVGAYNAALLVGVGVSAPLTGWLSRRVGGRALIRVTATGEAALRVGTFSLALLGAPLPLVAVGVALMGALAWTGFAGMRAEVAAASPAAHRARALAWYAGSIAAVEAMGAAAGALLPAGADAVVGGAPLAVVVALYGACLLPTFVVAGGARVAVRPASAPARPLRAQAGFLGGGFLVMLAAAGPTLIFVGLTAELHGRAWVAAAAATFTVGALVAPLAANAVERSALPPRVTWPLLGVGMVAGWAVAPLHPAGLLVAQLCSGAAMTAFEGVMDAASARADEKHPTAALGWAASTRALGGAAGVACVPAAVVVTGLGPASLAAAALLSAVALAGAAALVVVRLREPGPAVGRS
jgi:hypothetical protein